MNVVEIQKALATKGLYAGEVDGIAGKNTRRGVDEVLHRYFDLQGGPKAWHNWPDERRMVAFEQIVLKELDIEVGNVDGLVGEQTRYARSVFEARKIGKGDEVEKWRDKEPQTEVSTAKPVRWPVQKDVERFYGPKGENQVSLQLPFPFRIAWEPAKTVRAISCHKLVHDAMGRIWQNVHDHYGYERLKELRLDMYGGCLNVRRMRGGTSWSMHSWGIAIDIDPDRNQLKFGRDKATLDDAVYKDYWRFVYAEGAIGLGPERNYDWMHFQFARL